MRETSLEDFLGGSDDEPSDPKAREGDRSKSGESASDGTVEPKGEDDAADETVESAAATYAWTAEGAECADCGATVERRWRDGDRLVCADCKVW